MPSTMNIKVSRIHKLSQDGPVKAFVDITVNGVLLIKGLRIVEGPHGLFVTLPQEKGKNDRWYNTVHCLTNDLRAQFADCVLNAYKNDE